MKHFQTLLISASILAAQVHAQGGQTCSETTQCPESAPCCSEFGFCGTGDFCLGGCNPLASNTLDSCKPNPICQDASYDFSDLSRIVPFSSFDGNVSAADWTLDNGNITASNGAMGMTLSQTNNGTRLSSTRYVHYGTITATLKTGRWPGVVTAFITMSNVRDEIDWEWPGNQTLQGQSNYFWEGVIPAQTYGLTHNVSSDTYSNFHNYTIDWTPDALTWSIDGQQVRTLKASDTMVNGVMNYPQTPSRIQLSIWPAGISSEPQGTVEWAGGMINWNDPDYVAAGHFYAIVQSVDVKCADPTPPTANDTSYVYGTNATQDLPSVALSNASVLLNGAAAFVAGAQVSVMRYLAGGLAMAVGAGVLGLW